MKGRDLPVAALTPYEGAPYRAHHRRDDPLIDRLESAGHVRRIRANADRRRVTVELVPELNLDVDTIVEPARRLLGEVLASYSPEQVAILFDYFARAAPAFLAATHEVRGQATARRRRATPQGSQSRIGNR